MYVRKEALLSSQIEGTQSPLSDLLLFEKDEIPLVPIDDVQEVSNYVTAMNYVLKRLEEGFPFSLRLIREIHDVLLKKGRGRQFSAMIAFVVKHGGHASWSMDTRTEASRLHVQ
jgi:cell filamentation protein, protein adenylyltransferase